MAIRVVMRMVNAFPLERKIERGVRQAAVDGATGRRPPGILHYSCLS